MKKSLNTKEIKKIGLTPQEYCYKLISEKLLEIAKKFGGGGHVGACGFQVIKLPFDLPIRK